LKAMIVSPDPSGAHNWNPMAFHPATGLVYLPAKTNTEFVHPPDKNWKYDPASLNLGMDTYYDGPLYGDMAKMPPPAGSLLAWDPVAQKAVWSASYPVAEGGGVLATGGNLVFQGRADGIFAAYRATDGKQLWQFDAGTGIMAPPVTYTIDGTQYVTVMAGWGGSSALFNSPGQGKVKPGYGRMVTFAVGATGTLKAPAFGHKEPPTPAITMNVPAKTVHLGSMLYATHCADCHAQSGSAICQ
jgi:quinohemoprotein ethanol dehydrogenase